MYCGHDDVAGNHGANGVDDDSGTVANNTCGHDDGAHYDGSVFGDVQGCKLLGPRILRAVLWIQAGQHGGLSAS